MKDFVEAVNIELGGKTRRLRYDINAVIAVEDILNVSISEVGALLFGKVKVGDMVRILWAGLLHDEPNLTVAEVGRMIGSMENIGTFAEPLGRALLAGLPKPPAGATGEGKN